VVEEGTGLANAESYISVADADTYHTAQGNAAWTGTTDAKEQALRKATAYLDDKYAKRWRGNRANESQALRWPRIAVYDDDQFYVPSTSIPVKLKQACAVAAMESIGGLDLFVTETKTGSGDLTAKSVAVGPISFSKSFAGSTTSQPKIAKVEALLTSLLEWGLVRERA
jgi:hypothetical protein